MNRKTRLILAAIITLILAVAGTTVWAGSKQGSVHGKIHAGHGTCNDGAVNMGDATFIMTVWGKVVCDFEVTRTKVPNVFMSGAPAGLEFRSDGFIVSGGPVDGIGMLEACFAHSPQDEAHNAQIYAVFGSQQAILPAVKQGTPVQLCAATPNLNGIFAVVGTP